MKKLAIPLFVLVAVLVAFLLLRGDTAEEETPSDPDAAAENDTEGDDHHDHDHDHDHEEAHADNDSDERDEDFRNDPLARIAGEGVPDVVPPLPQELPEGTPPEEILALDTQPEDRLPVTAEWELQQNERLAEIMDDRIVRLDQRIQEAEAAGDEVTANRQRIIRERSEERRVEIQDEIERLQTYIAENPSEPVEPGSYEEGQPFNTTDPNRPWANE